MSDRSKALALTFARCVLGVTALLYGLRNVFGLFGGPGLSAFVAAASARVAVAGEVTAYVVAFGQLFGGISLILGPMAKVFAWGFLVFLAGDFFVNAGYQSFFLANGGCERLLALMAMSFVVAAHGPGAYRIEIKRGDKG